MRKLIIIIIIASFLTGCWWRGTGEHVGIITSAEKLGTFFRTGRIYFKTSTYSSQENIYCVDDEGLYRNIQSLADGKTLIKLHYHDEFWAAPWRCDGEDAILDSVEVIK